MMADEIKVWISRRKCAKGMSYHLRWLDAATGKWRSRRAGKDRKAAEHEARKLELRFAEGVYRDAKRISWPAFVADHVAKIEGAANRTESKRTLEEFATLTSVPSPRSVTYPMLERYVSLLREPSRTPADEGVPGNAAATINKKLRYVRAALNKAVKRGFLGTNPFDTSLFRSEERKPPRIVTDAEETTLLDASDDLYGPRMRGLVYAILNCGGRRGEMLKLGWERITLDGDGSQLHFSRTKSHRDRIVPINPSLVTVLRRLQPLTIKAGGPFVGMGQNLGRQWSRITDKAEVDVTLHDLRRTYICRLIRAGVPLPTVQKLAGHSDIKTTLTYYNWVSNSDLIDGVRKLERRTG